MPAPSRVGTDTCPVKTPDEDPASKQKDLKAFACIRGINRKPNYCSHRNSLSLALILFICFQDCMRLQINKLGQIGDGQKAPFLLKDSLMGTLHLWDPWARRWMRSRCTAHAVLSGDSASLALHSQCTGLQLVMLRVAGEAAFFVLGLGSGNREQVWASARTLPLAPLQGAGAETSLWLREAASHPHPLPCPLMMGKESQLPPLPCSLQWALRRLPCCWRD